CSSDLRVYQVFLARRALIRGATSRQKGRQAHEDRAEMAVDMSALRGTAEGTLVAGDVLAPLRAGHRHDPRSRVVGLYLDQVSDSRIAVATILVAACDGGVPRKCGVVGPALPGVENVGGQCRRGDSLAAQDGL